MFQATAIGFLVATVGCGDDSDSVGRPTEGVPGDELATSDEFSAPDSLILLSCNAETGLFVRPTPLTLSSVSATDGELRGTREVMLESTPAVDNIHVCGDDPLRRHRFNEDFSQVAAQIPGPNDAGDRAVAVEIPSGEVLGPAPDDDGFSTSPDDAPPVFHPESGDLWYVDGNTDRVLSRPADGSADAAVDQGEARGGDIVAITGQGPWLNSDLYEVVVNPSGSYGALSGNFADPGLWRQGGEAFDAVPFASFGGEPVPPCVPELWVDDHNLVCTQPDVFYRVTLTDDYGAVAEVQPLFPATDRHNESPVLSPDGDAFAFVSTQGTERAVYTQSFTDADAEPTKIVDLLPDDVLLAWE